MGGLGHVAIQFAHAMGAEVTVLSRSNNKKEEAKGATIISNHNEAISDKIMKEMDRGVTMPAD